jgi:tripartite ATP-independent transporter DctP family solute receptor
LPQGKAIDGEDVMERKFVVTRRALLGSAAALGAAASLPRAACAAEFEYKMGHSSPESHPFHKRLLEVSARIARESDGKMTLSIFANSQLGGDNDILSQARSGAIEFCQPAGLILSSILPLTAVNGMGFAFSDYSKVWPTMDGELGRYIRTQIAAKTGLFPMDRIWNLGFRQITTSSKPIKSAADLDGIKLRVPGAPALVSLFKAFGAYPVSMQFGEVYTSLQTRVVDGEENPLSVIDAGKFYEVQKYCSLTNHVWDGYWICANQRAWDRLPANLKDIVARSFNEGALGEREDLVKMDASLQSELEAKGLTFNKVDTASFRDRLRSAGFYKEWREKIGEEAWSLLEAQVGKLA